MSNFNSKEVIDAVMKQLKNDGTFGSLIKKAVLQLEEEGFMESLRTDGKAHSDSIFRKHFPNSNSVVDMSKELREKIMGETKAYALRPQLRMHVETKLKDRFKYEWIRENAERSVEDKVREALGLPPIFRPEDVKEEEEPETDADATEAEEPSDAQGTTDLIEATSEASQEDEEDEVEGTENEQATENESMSEGHSDEEPVKDESENDEDVQTKEESHSNEASEMEEPEDDEEVPDRRSTESSD